MSTSHESVEMNHFELIPVRIHKDSRQANLAVAQEIAQIIREKNAQGKKAVLGLATGSTPVGVYDQLIRMHKEEGLSFKDVITFNLDEYYPMQPDAKQSYRRFMNERLFDHIDIDKKNTHVPDGTVKVEDINAHCLAYEKAIKDAGGLDIQLLGIGKTGHVGFNEPGSPRNSRTRLITLDKLTRHDAAGAFFALENVPKRAITMGVSTILDSRRVILVAFGEHKSSIVATAVEGPVTPAVPASFLQLHSNAVVVVDEPASVALTRNKTPWVVGPVKWDSKMIRKAVTWLSLKENKPILKLTEEDYNEAGLQDLLAEHGSAYDININVFREFQNTITGWPGGKRPAVRRPDDRRRATDDIFPKRVLIFSPHPDDDVISMGGTLLRLVDQGHEVHVAYQTSGNIAVFDDDAIRFSDFVSEFNRLFGIDETRTRELESHIEEFLKNKKDGQMDSPEVRAIKGLIRRGEARAAGRYCGIPEDRLHFMDLPFYETGQERKKPVGEEDFKLTVELLQKVKPHQIYAAGDLADPHGTHRVCLDAVFEACNRVKNEDWYKLCEVWLYRGAWHEWAPEEIEMAVPFSPSELMRKRNAIFKHQSQKDRAMFPGTDAREFWQRAEDRNHETARLYDKLGLPEYEAIEGFVRWQG